MAGDTVRYAPPHADADRQSTSPVSTLINCGIHPARCGAEIPTLVTRGSFCVAWVLLSFSITFMERNFHALIGAIRTVASLAENSRSVGSFTASSLASTGRSALDKRHRTMSSARFIRPLAWKRRHRLPPVAVLFGREWRMLKVKTSGDQPHRTGGPPVDKPVFFTRAPSHHLHRDMDVMDRPLRVLDQLLQITRQSLKRRFRVVSKPTKPTVDYGKLSISICRQIPRHATVPIIAMITQPAPPHTNTLTANHQSDAGQPIPPAGFSIACEIIVERRSRR